MLNQIKIFIKILVLELRISHQVIKVQIKKIGMLGILMSKWILLLSSIIEYLFLNKAHGMKNYG